MASGGKLQAHQAVPGQIADFNIWQREMTLDDLNHEGCRTKGDIVSWNTLQEKGVSSRTEKKLTACDGKESCKFPKNLMFCQNYYCILIYLFNSKQLH